MKISLLLLSLLIFGCNPKQKPKINIPEENWSKRAININHKNNLIKGKSYLSVYSQIYNFSQNQKFNLTGMVSMRNVSETDTIYLLRADYYNTAGTKIRTYFDYPVYVLPMETLEIVISKKDIEGGTGSNFIIEWKTPLNCPDPLFEGIMNSIQGSQGVSFTTSAKRLE
ncbi:MAG: DUF3124 domain-containing protein [Flavobacteriales bacterium]|nr:DUF3124 domain-containing protein [Flavobacteriales bacterium]